MTVSIECWLYKQAHHSFVGRNLMKKIFLENITRPLEEPIMLKQCDTFLTKLRGFTFTRKIKTDEGLVLMNETESRLESAIHMLFVFFDLGVVWLDEKKVVVDLNLAKKWTSVLIPSKSAKFVVEVHPDRLKEFSIGDQLEFI